MKAYQEAFITEALAREALGFGEFTLKSGRVSPYFFNAGAFNSGEALSRLGRFYARAIADSGLAFDMLFGPAYKGIPLVAAVAVALAEEYGRDHPWAFNRKEAKDHGEGGQVVGAPLAGRVLVIDDVITAGTAISESAALLEASAGDMAGVFVALDRQERGQANQSALEEVETRWGVPVRSIVGMVNLVEYLHNYHSEHPGLEAMDAYRRNYGTE